MDDANLCTGPFAKSGHKMNVLFAYLLWLPPLGCFGLHHFYMKRDIHGFVTITTLAGFFFIGYIRDLWNIPRYLAESRRDEKFVNYYRAEVKYHKYPKFWRNKMRYLAMIFLAAAYRAMMVWAIPQGATKGDDTWKVKMITFLLAPLGTAFGTYCVSNIGMRRCSFLSLLILAYIGEMVFGVVQPGESSISLWMWIQPFIVMMFLWSYVDPDTLKVKVDNESKGRKRTEPGCCLRFWRIVLGLLIFSSLWFSFLYHNATIETDDGEKILLRDAVENLLRSEAWKHFKVEFWNLLRHLREEGWEGFADGLYDISEKSGKDWAAKVLGVAVNSAEKEVKARYRELVKMWHPDHAKDKENAQEKFIEIQKAYETFMKSFKRRKSTRFRSGKPSKARSWDSDDDDEL